MINILIADDHTIVREGLKQILAQSPDILVKNEASNAQEVIKKIRIKHLDLVLLDISLPGRSGLDVLKQIRSLEPRLPVLILSMYPEEQYAIRAIKAGASGYLTKESATSELLRAIRKVAAGGMYITSSLAEKIATELKADIKKVPHEALSDREYQIMCMIASGRSVKEIAAALFLSVKTISTHRARILEKMRMKNSAQLMHYAIKHNLVD